MTITVSIALKTLLYYYYRKWSKENFEKERYFLLNSDKIHVSKFRVAGMSGLGCSRAVSRGVPGVVVA